MLPMYQKSQNDARTIQKYFWKSLALPLGNANLMPIGGLKVRFGNAKDHATIMPPA